MEFAFQILQISPREGIFFFSMDKFAISFRGLPSFTIENIPLELPFEIACAMSTNFLLKLVI